MARYRYAPRPRGRADQGSRRSASTVRMRSVGTLPSNATSAPIFASRLPPSEGAIAASALGVPTAPKSERPIRLRNASEEAISRIPVEKATCGLFTSRAERGAAHREVGMVHECGSRPHTRGVADLRQRHRRRPNRQGVGRSGQRDERWDGGDDACAPGRLRRERGEFRSGERGHHGCRSQRDEPRRRERRPHGAYIFGNREPRHRGGGDRAKTYGDDDERLVGVRRHRFQTGQPDRHEPRDRSRTIGAVRRPIP